MGKLDSDEKFLIGFFSSILTIVGVPFLGLGAHGINALVVNNTEEKLQAELAESKNAIVQSMVAGVEDISNFDLASVELSREDNDYIMKAFGSTSVEEIIGVKQNQFVSLLFNIQEKDAQKILDAVKTLDETERRPNYDTPEHTAIMDDANGWKFTENSRIKKTGSACKQVYNAINDAVKNAYSSQVEPISEASQMNNSIASSYRFVRPEVVSDTNVGGLFTHGSTTFINSGIMTTNISGVVKDEEKNESYFFIDTVQGYNKGQPGSETQKIVLDSCRAMVVVEGTDLSAEEIYAKFISGEHKRFVEVVRERAGEKTGVVNGKLTNDVEEIELM